MVSGVVGVGVVSVGGGGGVCMSSSGEAVLLSRMGGSHCDGVRRAECLPIIHRQHWGIPEVLVIYLLNHLLY